MEKRQPRRNTTVNWKKNAVPFVPSKKPENVSQGDQTFAPNYPTTFQGYFQYPQQEPQSNAIPQHIKQAFESRDQSRSSTWSTAADRKQSITEQQIGSIMQNNQATMKKLYAQNQQFDQQTFDQNQVQPESLKEIYGHICEYAMSQQGSRFLQRALERATLDELDQVLYETLPKVPDLMVHPYANYMCQSLFVSCSAQQRLQIIKAIKHQIPQLSMDRCGTHSLQGLVGLASIPQEEELYSEILENYLYSLSVHAQATHVVQKIIQVLSPQMRVKIIDRILQMLPNLVCDAYGLCVVKKCIQVVENKQREKLLAFLSNSVLELVQSPYGNYAIQAAIQEWGPEYCFSLYEQILDRVPQLSIQKFASNVIERCIETSPPILRKRFIEMLCKPDSIKMILNSNFASFVIKKALQISTEQENVALREEIKNQLDTISDKKLRAKWETFL